MKTSKRILERNGYVRKKTDNQLNECTYYNFKVFGPLVTVKVILSFDGTFRIRFLHPIRIDDPELYIALAEEIKKLEIKE